MKLYQRIEKEDYGHKPGRRQYKVANLNL